MVECHVRLSCYFVPLPHHVPTISRRCTTVPQPDDFAVLVRLARERSGLSRREAAAQLGVDPRTISRWETGRHRPHRLPAAVARLAVQEWISEGDQLQRRAGRKSLGDTCRN